MKRWQRFLMNGTVWLTAEIILGLMGLDHLADYSEFLQVRSDRAPQASTIVMS